MTDANPNATPEDGPRRKAGDHRGWLVFFGAVIVVAGLSFAFKFYEFFYDLSSQQGFRFAGAHLGTYLLVAAGFFLLLLFAWLHGHFADIEQPKYDILEKEIERDRARYE